MGEGSSSKVPESASGRAHHSARCQHRFPAGSDLARHRGRGTAPTGDGGDRGSSHIHVADPVLSFRPGTLASPHNAVLVEA